LYFTKQAGIVNLFIVAKGTFLPMRKTVNLLQSSNWLRLIALCLLISALNGCATTNKSAPQEPWLYPKHVEQDIERNKFQIGKGDDLIGRLAVVKLEKGDTLPDIARHFGLGINAISSANPKVDVWAPKGEERVVLPLSFILPDTPRKGIVVNLATMRLFQYKGDGKSLSVATYPVGVGAEDRPTPTGPARIVRKVARPTWHVPASIAERHRQKGDILPAQIPPGPDNPLGEYALYLSKAGYLVHGTNKPASVGLQATNGCMRLYPENIKMLFNDTPVNTPVVIVNQPYLVGQRYGTLYMEAHAPLENSSPDELRKTYEKLRTIEKKSARKFDWNKIKKVQAEALGYPVPIFDMRQGSGNTALKTVEVEHPDKLYGKPKTPELKLDGWYILAASVREEIDAQRLAAIINHQGPQIPALVLSNSTGYRVVAGPFKNAVEAQNASKRLKFDLDIDGVLIEPVKKI